MKNILLKKNVTIGIIGALDKEIASLRNYIQPLKRTKVYNKTLYIGKLYNINIILIKSGIGKVASSVACTILLNLCKLDLIINIGTAGSLNMELIPGNIVLPNSTCYHDVDLTVFGYSLGQIQNFPKLFLVNNFMMRLAETCIIKSKIKYKTDLIISGDSFISKIESRKILKKNFPTAIAVDMESTAIAQVCYQFKKPFLIIKSISDSSDNYAVSKFEQFVTLASKQFSKIIRDLLYNLYTRNIPKIHQNYFK
ncbi:5'-methylthioadenosine/adenosylhomocysteine nucleosidase [Buchnera aphidicola]|uniref:adenosylhomocysteine nucleosidase n=1 Tax=Buchnera aphidicola subsp. Melaphis rhois TaxID=118103 RepID=A0A4D6Y2D1_BUCMH|nr:5'-methylthioadenosine/adenosylhomocysteine nucleosidase [Buchnera aphidicola]QCI23227.1 5'-methylthioadenosine/adenosylhomocysteine nucleosidase [Buchnera aphidicola (Melaphis rhois)]